MSKRFSDTEIWKKKWYCDLCPGLKSFWKYICDSCDNAGVWEINIELASYQIKYDFTECEILESFKTNIIKISDSKMLVVDFISFQYGYLKESCIPHRHIFNLLKHHGLTYPIDTLSIPYRMGIDTLKDKDKDKDKDKGDCKGEAPDQEPEKVTKKRFVQPTLQDVSDYCKERKNNVSPEKWMAYYESIGWKVGKNPMKSWQAAVRTWEKNDYNNSQPAKTYQERKSEREYPEEFTIPMLKL